MNFNSHMIYGSVELGKEGRGVIFPISPGFQSAALFRWGIDEENKNRLDRYCKLHVTVVEPSSGL